MRLRHRLAIGSVLVALGLASLPAQAEERPSIADRVVAVVGEQPILLSELRQRARLSQHAAAEDTSLEPLLSRMIDERLEDQAVAQARVSATDEEIDTAIRRVAEQTMLTTSEVVDAAKRRGLSERDYREEIRHEIVDRKLVERKIRARVEVTERDVRSAYTRWATELARTSVELRTITIPIRAGASPAAIASRAALASQIVERARNGEGFCQLGVQYSLTPNVWNCRSRTPLPRSALPPEIAHAIASLKPGETADPVVPFRDAAGAPRGLVVVQLVAVGGVPPYEEVEDRMKDLARIEVTERARRDWLRALRRKAGVETRL